MFPNEHQNFETINSQFSILADLEIIKSHKNENISNYWTKIFEIKNESNEYTYVFRT